MTFKNTIKSWSKSCLLRTGVLRLHTLLLPPSALILCYHSVSHQRAEQSAIIDAGITVDAERFNEQMYILRKEYHPISLDDLADWLENKKSIPRRSVAVTFDDGFADNYHVAAPIMEKYDIFGTIYLAVDAVHRQKLPWYCRLHYLFHQAAQAGFVLNDPETGKVWHCGSPEKKKEAEHFYARSCVVLGESALDTRIAQIESLLADKLFGDKRLANTLKKDPLDSSLGCSLPSPLPRMMTWEQAKELIYRGHLIGSHTLSHGIVGLLSAEQIHREIGDAHQILEQELGKSVQHFSYPHPYQIDPQWNDDSFQETKTLGYRSAVLTRLGRVQQKDNPLLLSRLYIGNDSAESFRWRLEKAFAERGIS